MTSPTLRAARRERSWTRPLARAELRLRSLSFMLDAIVIRVADAALDAWWRSAHIRREALARALASLFGVLVSLGVLEAALRFSFTPLPYDLGDHLLGCYRREDTHHGIHFAEPRMRVVLQKPRFDVTCFANGYRWHHRGDRWGFRNPEDWDRVEIALIGDSYVYGQSIAERDTIAHQLRNELGVRVANLGVATAGPREYVAYLRNFALRLSPKVIVILYFANDAGDVLENCSREELHARLDSGQFPEFAIYEPTSLFESVFGYERWTTERAVRHILSYQLYRYYRSRIEAFWYTGSVASWRDSEGRRQMSVVGATLDADEGSPALLWIGGGAGSGADSTGAPQAEKSRAIPLSTASKPPSSAPLGAPDVESYIQKSIEAMAASARDAGVRLVVGYIPEEPNERRPGLNGRFIAVLSEAAEQSGAAFVDFTSALLSDQGGYLPDVMLPHEWHPSPTGAARIATRIAEFLGQQHIDFRR